MVTLIPHRSILRVDILGYSKPSVMLLQWYVIIYDIKVLVNHILYIHQYVTDTHT